MARPKQTFLLREVRDVVIEPRIRYEWLGLTRSGRLRLRSKVRIKDGAPHRWTALLGAKLVDVRDQYHEVSYSNVDAGLYQQGAGLASMMRLVIKKVQQHAAKALLKS